MKQNIGSLQQIYDKVNELNRKNNLLKAKYENDAKYARVHKRIVEKGNITDKESKIGEVLMNIKKDADGKVLINAKLLNNESYFNDLMMQMVVSSFENTDIKLEPESARYINNCVTREYISEYQGMPIL